MDININITRILRIFTCIGKQIDGSITDKEIYNTVLHLGTQIFDDKIFDDGEEGCKIIGVEKPTNGEIKYLIKWKINSLPEFHYVVDSSVLRSKYPEMIIEFYEKIITWS